MYIYYIIEHSDYTTGWMTDTEFDSKQRRIRFAALRHPQQLSCTPSRLSNVDWRVPNPLSKTEHKHHLPTKAKNTSRCTRATTRSSRSYSALLANTYVQARAQLGGASGAASPGSTVQAAAKWEEKN